MFRRHSRIIWFVVGVLALAGVVIIAGVVYAQGSLPQISGTVRVPGLHGRVIVARDKWGVPHLYAGDEHDLFVAQGYITAQDRLWQMLLRRLAAQGQLSAWLGARATQADSVLDVEEFPAQADAALMAADEDTRTVLEAYALGVNACLASCPEPPELALLKRQGKVTQVSPWTAVDSMALARMTQWAQQKYSALELQALLSGSVGFARMSDLWVERDVPTGAIPSGDPAMRQAVRLAGIPLLSGGGATPVMAISGPGLPVPWYMAVLRSPRIAVAGGTWPGMPGVVVAQGTADVGMSAYLAAPQQQLVTYLLALPPSGPLQTRVHGMLRQWDYDLSGRTREGNASAAVYEAWVWHLARDAFQDELGAEMFARYWGTGFVPSALARLADRPSDTWWDDVMTPEIETRDDLMRRAYAEALTDLGRHYGDLHTIWEWDAMHAAAFDHPLGGAQPLSWLLDRTAKLGGDAPFDPASPDDLVHPYASALVSALRLKQEANGQMSFTLAGGQSGNPFSPHYADLLPQWTRLQSVPLQDAARPQDLRDVEGVLVLTP